MTRIWVTIAGSLGLVVPLWTLGWYTDGDGFARTLIAAIVAGLVVGVVELLRRARRIDGLLAELSRLDGEASGLAQRLEGASELFGRLVRSRMRGEPTLLPAVTLTPYLVSLLVLLGLLGTFIGLVETLAGAREALGSSSDVAALRAALLVPMKGLSRAFGTSVAGVSASALLGLALTLARRFEGRVYADLDQKFAGSLAETTLVGRQIHALERLADQSDDLPNAVRDLSQVASRLPTLEDTIAERHREIMQVIRDAVEQSAADIRKSLADGVQTAVTDQKGWMDTLVHRADELLTERAAGFAERLERDAEARAQAEEQRLAALHDAEQRRVGELRDHLERLSTSQMEWLSSFERRLAEWRTAEEERITKAWTRDAEERRSQAERDASRWSAWQTQEEERAAALREQMEKISLDEERRGRQATDALVASTELASGLMGQLQDAVAKLVVLDEEARAARRSELEAMRTESARWLERADERNTAEQERWQTWVETLQSQYAGLESTAAARVEELTQLLGLMMQEQRAATEATLAKTSSAVEQMDAHASERLRELAERIGQMADARLADERALELELRQSRQQAAEGLAASLQRYADEIRSEFSAATLALRDGADAIAGGGVELMALADRFADAVTAYRSANDSWLDRLAHWETQKIEGDTGQLDAEMGAYLDQTREVFDRSLDMQRELFAGLRGMRIEEHTEPHVEEEALTGASSPTLRARAAAHQALPFDPGAGEPTRTAGPLPVDDDLPAQSAPSSDRERADVVTRRHDEAGTPDAELAEVELAAEGVPEPGGEPANPGSERATDEVPELGSEPTDGARAPDDTRKRKRSAKKKSPELAQHAERAHEVTPESKAAPSASADVEVS